MYQFRAGEKNSFVPLNFPLLLTRPRANQLLLTERGQWRIGRNGEDREGDGREEGDRMEDRAGSENEEDKEDTGRCGRRVECLLPGKTHLSCSRTRL